jgi:hypothetical protein
MVRRHRCAGSRRSFRTAYGITGRIGVTLTLPFSYDTHSRFYADGKRHTVQASGLGDVSLGGNIWLRNPELHRDGNVSIGFGLKAPTGNNQTLAGL